MVPSICIGNQLGLHDVMTVVPIILQAFASSITGTLATQSLLKGVGVGDENASALAATITWILKGMTIELFSYLKLLYQCSYIIRLFCRWNWDARKDHVCLAKRV